MPSEWQWLYPPGAAQFTGFHFSTPVTILHECVFVILGQNRSLVNHLETDALVKYLESLKKKRYRNFLASKSPCNSNPITL